MTDERAHDPLNALVSRSLLAGLSLALLAMGAGVVLAVARGLPIEPAATPLPLLAALVAAGDPTAAVSLGIAILLATPALRVAVLLGAYLKRRDWLFAAIAAAVLAILALSLRVGVP